MYDTLEYLAYSALCRFLSMQRKDKSEGTAEVLKFRIASEENSDMGSDPDPETN